MKNLLKPLVARFGRLGSATLLGAALSLMAAPSAHAQDTTPRWAGVEKTSDLSYRVWACNPAAKPGLIRLLDHKGDIYYEQFSSATNFGRKFNLSELPNGNYTILVKIGRDEHRFNVNRQSATRQWADVSEVRAVDPRLVSLQEVNVPTPR